MLRLVGLCIGLRLVIGRMRHDNLACARNIRKSQNHNRIRRAGLPDVLALVVDHGTNLTECRTGRDEISNVKRSLLYQHIGNGTSAAVQLRLQNQSSCKTVRVRLQLHDICLQKDGIQKVLHADAGLCRDIDKFSLSAPVSRNQLILRKLLLDAGRICLRLIHLIDRNDDFNACCLCMIDCLHGLRHHAVIRCNNQNRNIRRLGTAQTHRRKRLMSGRIQEGNLPAVHINRVSTDRLRDSAGLLLRHSGVADVVQNGGLAVVNMTHDADNRRTGNKALFLVFIFLQKLLNDIDLFFLLAEDIIVSGNVLRLLIGHL